MSESEEVITVTVPWKHLPVTIDFPRVSPGEFAGCSTESEKCVSEFWRYTLWDGMPAVGLDLASGGRPSVPWAISVDLPHEAYHHYNGGNAPRGPLQWRGYVDQNLPFESESMAFTIASHILEDFTRDRWPRLFSEWSRVIRHGGHLIILVPDKERWNWAIKNLGQCPNCSHAHEPELGEISETAREVGLQVVEERLTELVPHDYGILGVFRKP